ncbi:MAG TPA: patatin-like phospholipase family protein, partial [Pirellulales bacterium]|nr:patatin-like phospholipase family protein [Pirellulales bacterium]
GFAWMLLSNLVSWHVVGWHSLEPGAMTAFGALFMLIGAWFLVVRFNLHGDPPHLGLRMTAFGRRIWVLLLANIVGELSWYLVNVFTALPFQFYTIWALFHILFSLYLVANFLDLCQFSPGQEWHIRPTIVLIGIGYVALFLRPCHVGKDSGNPRQPLEPTDLDSITIGWFDQIETAIKAVPNDGPVVFVAASGGGSRAALFTALVLEGLSHLQVQCHSETGKSAATAADRIVLFSSVSGGSLGTAYYLRHAVDPNTGMRGAPPSRETYRQTDVNDLKTRMAHFATIWTQRVATQAEKSAYEQIQKECDDLMEGKSDMLATAPWLFNSAFVDDMCTDFMAPLLRGVLFPGVERGQRVSRFWEDRFDWTGLDNHKGFPARAPVAFFNATNVETGTRLAIAFPRAPLELLQLPATESSKYQPKALSDIDGNYLLQLAEAVRLSANFPYGFQVAALRPNLLVMDGGIVDNTGIDTIVYLLEGLRHFAKASAPPKSVPRRAFDLLQTLKYRGVVLVEIDSGAKQTKPPTAALLFHTLWPPAQALENAGYANADLSKYDRIAAALQILNEPPVDSAKLGSGASSPHGQTPEFISALVTFTCNHSENVMTSWALGPDDKAKIIVQFLVDWQNTAKNFQLVYKNVCKTARLRREQRDAKPGSEKSRQLTDQRAELSEKLKDVPKLLMVDTLAKQRTYQEANQGANVATLNDTSPLLNKSEMQKLQKMWSDAK